MMDIDDGYFWLDQDRKMSKEEAEDTYGILCGYCLGIYELEDTETIWENGLDVCYCKTCAADIKAKLPVLDEPEYAEALTGGAGAIR